MSSQPRIAIRAKMVRQRQPSTKHSFLDVLRIVLSDGVELKVAAAEFAAVGQAHGPMVNPAPR